MKDSELQQQVLKTIIICKQQQKRNMAAQEKPQMARIRSVQKQVALKTKAVAASHMLFAKDSVLSLPRRCTTGKPEES